MDGSIIIVIILAIGAFLNVLKDRKEESLYRFKLEKKKYMNSHLWYIKRQEVLKRDNYTCQGCGIEDSLDVHHISYKNAGNEPLEDLIAVCRKCHSKIHQKYGYEYENTFPLIKQQ